VLVARDARLKPCPTYGRRKIEGVDSHAAPIDLRSDTVTRPTPDMRAAMAAAVVGDDVFGDDPTVNELERRAAERVEKEAAVFVPSGTMGNLASLLAHCARGREVIVGDEAHIYHYEAGGASALGGLIYHTVPTERDGSLPLAALERAIRPSAHNSHLAPAGVICLENTHNRMGGTVIAPEYTGEVAALATRHGLPVHLDGARIFDAAVATGRPVTAWTDHVSSVQFCLSKALAAPIGSIVAGTAPFVREVRRIRKMLGGGMRQVGVIAAAGLVALDTMVERLAEDHANARLLAEHLSRVPGVTIDLSRVQTNIVLFEPPVAWEPDAFVEAARAAGVWLVPFGGRRIRAMTHADVTGEECVEAGRRLAQICATR
jgi:threonine aldolase